MTLDALPGMNVIDRASFYHLLRAVVKNSANMILNRIEIGDESHPNIVLVAAVPGGEEITKIISKEWIQNDWK